MQKNVYSYITDKLKERSLNSQSLIARAREIFHCMLHYVIKN